MNIRRANNELHRLGTSYHDAIPNATIDAILTENGMKDLEEGIYCGRDGRINENVGGNVWFTMTWHKMEQSGRYEIVAYLSKGNPRDVVGSFVHTHDFILCADDIRRCMCGKAAL